MARIREHKLAVAAAAVTAMIAGSAAWAAIPDANGVITSCKDSAGYVRVIDTATTTTCPSGTTPLRWGSRGPTGPIGPTGISGNANTAWVHLDKNGKVEASHPASTLGGRWADGRYWMYASRDLTRCAIQATPASWTSPGITTAVIQTLPNYTYVDAYGIVESSWPVRWKPVPTEIHISATC